MGGLEGGGAAAGEIKRGAYAYCMWPVGYMCARGAAKGEKAGGGDAPRGGRLAWLACMR